MRMSARMSVRMSARMSVRMSEYLKHKIHLATHSRTHSVGMADPVILAPEALHLARHVELSDAIARGDMA